MRVAYYFWYKFFNSVFVGLSVGVVFTLYAPLSPSVFNLGGIALALAMMGVAMLYKKILNTRWLFWILLGVEGVLLAVVVIFLLYPNDSALLIYLGYQLTFVFGSYAVRAETLILSKEQLLSRADIYKQGGYLGGLVAGFFAYLVFEYLAIVQKEAQIYALHYLLLALQIGVIYLLLNAFKQGNIKTDIDKM